MHRYILPLFLLLSCTATARPDTSLHVYYGLLHAHTMICDGSGTPAEAYAMARKAGLHFFAVTPHNHIEAESGAGERKDGISIARMHELYNGNRNVTVTRKWKTGGTYRSEQVTLTPLIQAAHNATDRRFVALYGQEFSTISTGNHVNVLGVDHVLTTENGNYRLLLDHLRTAAPGAVIQLNHPEVEQDLFATAGSDKEKRRMYNDYGIDAGDLGPAFSNWAGVMQPYTHLIELLSGPAMAQTRTEDYHYHDNANDYFFYLKQGIHVSPSAGQDNHYRTWGTVTDARTGVVAPALSEAMLYDAFRRNRTFVTEDKNLTAVLYVNDSVMGATLHTKTAGALQLSVLLRDADEAGAGYDVEVVMSSIQPEVSTAARNHKETDGIVSRTRVKGNGLHTLPVAHAMAGSSFCYLRIKQAGGDRAWTSPVWIQASGNAAAQPAATATQYYWTTSSSSKVYHTVNCPAVRQIKATNRRSGTKPPADRKPHECVTGQ